MSLSINVKRFCFIHRKFDTALDIGCGRGYVGRHLFDDMVAQFYQMDIAEKLLVLYNNLNIIKMLSKYYLL